MLHLDAAGSNKHYLAFNLGYEEDDLDVLVSDDDDVYK